jgi:hypothetical protein
MAISATQVIVPSQAASTLLVTGSAATSQVWLQATQDDAIVFIGPSGVTPQTGLPLPRGKLVGPILISDQALHAVVGEGQGSVAVRVFAAPTA